jgi:hypothetical protein
MKCKAVALFLVWIGVLMASPGAFGAPVDEDEAVAAADLWFAMELNSSFAKLGDVERAARLDAMRDRQVLYLVSKDNLVEALHDRSRLWAYVVKYQPGGYVVVSADDRIKPVIAFDVKSEFRWDRPETNSMRHFLGRSIEAHQGYLTRTVEADIDPDWSYLRMRLLEEQGLSMVTADIQPASIYVYWNSPLWGQGTYYNAEVLAHNGNTAGIPTGCTATAMAIKMRFHSWPITGNSSHSYTDNDGSIRYSHSANFGATTYNWSAMPMTSLTSANADVAQLMYHCGIAVEMDYEVNASGAWPSASAMNRYFLYKGTIERTSSHEQPIIDSVRAGAPVVISSSKHTVLVTGYRDTPSPYFYLNAGWNGSSNGWANLDDMPGGDSTIDRSYPYSSPGDYVYVDAAWAGSESGTIANPYNALAEGNSAVPSGGHLMVKAGTYTGTGNVPIVFTKAMTIQSYQGTAIVR